MPAPHHSVFTGQMHVLPPSQQHQSIAVYNYCYFNQQAPASITYQIACQNILAGLQQLPTNSFKTKLEVKDAYQKMQ